MAENGGKNKALVPIDDANIYYGYKTAGWEINFEKFRDWLKMEFEIIDMFFFGGIITKKVMGMKRFSGFSKKRGG